MLVIANINAIARVLTSMKINQAAAIPPHLRAEGERIGQLLARLRVARRVPQAEAAIRAAISRNTAYRIERGDPGVAFGQVLRYLDAIAPGSTLADLLTEADPALIALRARERRQRVRSLTPAELEDLNF